MRGEIPDDAAAGELPHEAPGPRTLGVGAVVAEQVDPDVADLADSAGRDQAMGELNGRGVAVVEADGRGHAGGRDRVGDLLGLGQVASGGLLDPDVLARLGGGHGDVAVGEVRAGDTDQVDVVAADELAPLGCGPRDAEDFAGVVEAAVVGRVRDADQVRSRAQVGVVLQDAGQRLGVDLPHPAEADDADVDVLSHRTSSIRRHALV